MPPAGSSVRAAARPPRRQNNPLVRAFLTWVRAVGGPRLLLKTALGYDRRRAGLGARILPTAWRSSLDHTPQDMSTCRVSSCDRCRQASAAGRAINDCRPGDRIPHRLSIHPIASCAVGSNSHTNELLLHILTDASHFCHRVQDVPGLLVLRLPGLCVLHPFSTDSLVGFWHGDHDVPKDVFIADKRRSSRTLTFGSPIIPGTAALLAPGAKLTEMNSRKGLLRRRRSALPVINGAIFGLPRPDPLSSTRRVKSPTLACSAIFAIR